MVYSLGVDGVVAVTIQPDAAAEARLGGDQVFGRGGDVGHEPGVNVLKASQHLGQGALAVLLGLEGCLLYTSRCV